MAQAALTCRERNACTDGRRTGIGVDAGQENRTVRSTADQEITGLAAGHNRIEFGTVGRTRERQRPVVSNVHLLQGISDTDIVVVAPAARQHIVVVTGCNGQSHTVNDVLAEVRTRIAAGELQIVKAAKSVRDNQCLERIETARFEQIRLIEAASHVAATGTRQSNVQNRTGSGRQAVDNQLSKLVRVGAETQRPFKHDRAALNRQVLEGIDRRAAACNSQRRIARKDEVSIGKVMRIVGAGSTPPHGHVQTVVDLHGAREAIPLFGKTEGLVAAGPQNFKIAVAGKGMRNIERIAGLRERQPIAGSGQSDGSAGTAEDRINRVRRSTAHGSRRTAGQKPVATEVRVAAGNFNVGRPNELNRAGARKRGGKGAGAGAADRQRRVAARAEIKHCIVAETIRVVQIEVMPARQYDSAREVVGAVNMGLCAIGKSDRQRAGAGQGVGSIVGIGADFQSANRLVMSPEGNLRTA